MKSPIAQIMMLALGLAWLISSMYADTAELEHFRVINSSVWLVGSLIVGVKK
jgi:hypothetical protein